MHYETWKSEIPRLYDYIRLLKDWIYIFEDNPEVVLTFQKYSGSCFTEKENGIWCPVVIETMEEVRRMLTSPDMFNI